MTEAAKVSIAEGHALRASYDAAGSWVRSCNAYIWELARIFVPLSLGASVLAITPDQASHKHQLCAASFGLAGFWWFVAIAYSQSTVRAREVLMRLEHAWSLDAEFGHYTREGQLAYRWFGVYMCLGLHVVVLGGLWAFILCAR